MVRRGRSGSGIVLRLTRRGRRTTLIVAGVAAALVLATAVPAYADTLPTGPSTTGVTGLRPNATRVSFPLSDRFQASVDVGTGNLNVAANLISLPGINGNASVGLSYNSLDTTSGSGNDAVADAKSWTYSFDGAGSLSVQSNGTTMDFTAGDGSVWPFVPVSGSSTAYTSPGGLPAVLTKTTSGWSLFYLGSSTTVAFDSSGEATSVTDKNGNATTIDLADGVMRSTAGTSDASFLGMYFGSDTDLLYQSVDGSLARYATVQENSDGRVESIADFTRTPTYFNYNSAGLLSQIFNADGAETDISYDSSNRVTEVDQLNSTSGSAGTSTTRFDYVSSTSTEVAGPDTSTSSSVPSVPHVTYTIDGNGMVTNVVDQVGRVRSATYNGNLDTLTSTVGSGASASTTTNVYGANSGLSQTSSTGQSGAQEQAAYTNSSPTQYLPSSTTDDAGNQTTYTYDGVGNQLTSTTPAVAAAATLTYNSNGTVATATAPGNGTNDTSYTYNSHHQLSGITPVTGSSLGSKAFTYDSYGRLASETDGAGRTTSYTYDADDRVLTTSFSDSTSTVTNTYDDAGNLTEQASGSGTITNSYDDLNQLISTANTAGGGTIGYGYDRAGNEKTMTSGIGTVTNSFDASGVLTRTVHPSGSGTATNNFATNSHGQRTDEWLAANTGNTTWAGHIQTSYDGSGRVGQVLAQTGPASSATTAIDVYYCYNTGGSGTSCGTTAANDRSKLQWTYDTISGQTTTYTYDTSGRLTQAAQSGGSGSNNTYAYTYDANGNRLTAATSGSNSTSQTLTYNAADQITSTGYSYDGAGNLTASPGATYTYNAAEQMTSATIGSTTHEYTYAGDSQTDVLSITGGSKTETYTYGKPTPDGTAELISYNNSDASSATFFDNDPHTGQAIMSEEQATSDAGLYVYDGTGNPIALLASFDSVSQSNTYDPYGVTTVSASSIPDVVAHNPYGFKMGVQDHATGFIKFGQRWYNPATGNWTQQDTLDAPLDPANANRYAYAGDDPINNEDPVGNLSEAFICGVVLTGVTLALAALLGAATDGIADALLISAAAAEGVEIGTNFGLTAIAGLFAAKVC